MQNYFNHPSGIYKPQDLHFIALEALILREFPDQQIGTIFVDLHTLSWQEARADTPAETHPNK